MNITYNNVSTCDRLEIPLTLVVELMKEQFPQWSHLLIRPVTCQGWDNKTFRLGEEMLIRLPTAQRYAQKVHIEQKWLPILASHLSFHIPQPIALGMPSQQYPFNWSIYRWIAGESANMIKPRAMCWERLATQLAQFLHELHAINTTDAPESGPHNFYRGGSLAVYDAQTQSAITQLHHLLDVQHVIRVWKKALSSQWDKKPVWIHGDLSSGNIIIQEQSLVGVIDFGGMSVGDPACDLVIAWTFLNSESRKIFKSLLGLDIDTWSRARGWALWKALITIASLEKNREEVKDQLHIINVILDEHRTEV